MILMRRLGSFLAVDVDNQQEKQTGNEKKIEALKTGRQAGRLTLTSPTTRRERNASKQAKDLLSPTRCHTIAEELLLSFRALMGMDCMHDA